MCDGFPVPDFDFDDGPMIPIDHNLFFTPHAYSAFDLTSLTNETDLIIDCSSPIRSTGNSTVYTARSTVDNVESALKISKNKHRIWDEYHKRLNLPASQYLVESHNVYETHSLCALQMELCPDGDLTQARLKEKEIWKLIHDVASAIDIIHRNGWLHLDVSPSNILRSGAFFKLADFGTLVKNGEFASGMEGAGPYVSPETLLYDNMCEEKDVSYPTDIFSFGVVLLEIASGFLAPRGGEERYAQIRKGQIKLGGDLYRCPHSQRLISLVNQMLDPVPGNRPTASDLITCSRT